MEEDWGLQAIVRGCTHDNYMTTTNRFDFTNYYHDDTFYTFPDFQQVENINDNNSFMMNELDDLYNKSVNYDPTVGSFSPVSDVSKSVVDEELVKLEKLAEDDHVKETAVINVKPKAATPSTKYKRKNQLKRVVVQVTAEGLSSDLWAWRKYGQKPIKGSPYPRSYYRCSSSKGCLARKQVEQSCSDPGMYIITYTAEHNHSHPTRRSSLAGTNRQKFTTLKRTSSGESCVSSSSTTRKENSNSSPTSQMIVPRVDEVQPHKKMKHEKIDRTVYDYEEMVQEINGGDDEFIIPDSILTDDFFVGLDDLDGLISKSSFYSSSSQQLR